ncbi:restriction endonuclease [Streptomyces tsukubensis]
MTHTVLYDPQGLIEAELPLDREPYESLVAAVLAWPVTAALPAADCQQIALQLTGHARAVAADVQRRAALLPESDGRRALAEIELGVMQRCLATPLEGTVSCAQGRARTVRELYTRLDRLMETRPGRARPVHSGTAPD